MNTAKLKGKMRELSITQEKLAERMGISISTLNRKLQAEHGESFTVGEAMKISEILELTGNEAQDIFLL